jgi:hypothetical protein
MKQHRGFRQSRRCLGLRGKPNESSTFQSAACFPTRRVAGGLQHVLVCRYDCGARPVGGTSVLVRTSFGRARFCELIYNQIQIFYSYSPITSGFQRPTRDSRGVPLALVSLPGLLYLGLLLIGGAAMVGSRRPHPPEAVVIVDRDGRAAARLEPSLSALRAGALCSDGRTYRQRPDLLGRGLSTVARL